MLVAEGAVDISAEPEVSLWDLAALQVIVQEAGGRFTSLAGVATPDGGSVVCTNGHLHDEVARPSRRQPATVITGEARRVPRRFTARYAGARHPP